MTALGDWVLARTAGLPVRLWLAAANPDLTAALRRLVEAEARYADLGQVLAAEIGEVLVPHPAVDGPTRRTSLECRRRLHRGAPVDPARIIPLRGAALKIGRTDLAEWIGTVSRLAESLAAQRAELAAAVDAELHRLLAAPWTAITESPIGRRALLDGTITAGEDIEERVRREEPWHGKRLRQRGDYLWRMIARGAAKTTPRGWLGHVCLVPVGPGQRYSLSLTPKVAARWTENVHAARVLLTDRPAPGDAAQVALAPLHRVDGDHLDVWLVRPDQPTKFQSIRLRMTPQLAAVRAAVRSGARPLADVAAAASPDPADRRQVATLRGFVTRLIELGLCQVSAPPQVRRTGWRTTEEPADRLAEPGTAGFVDVYRQSAGTWPATTCTLVESALGSVQRLNALMTADQRDTAAPLLSGVGPQPRPALDLLADRLSDGERAADRGWMSAQWPVACRPDSGYARLLEVLAAVPDGRHDSPFGHQVVDITGEMLDRLGAPRSAYEWPVDCVVRPLRSGEVVLDSVASAGMLDARFTAELAALHGPLRHVEAYREFLRLLDAETGVRSVELLVPSLSERAANAVRRPLYTDAWTGDPDLTAYCSTKPETETELDAATYIPVDALTVRRSAGRLLVEADGSPVRILYHATRHPPPPWDLLLSILLGGPTSVAMRFRRLRHSLAAVPHRSYLPRVTVDGSVIVTPAQWCIRPADLWDTASSSLAKARHLARLRDRLGLPRWIMVCPGLGGRPVPCDLDSLRALAVFESVAVTPIRAPDVGDAIVIVIEEMVPTPEELPVQDTAAGRADPVAAELMLRLPHDVDVATLAHRTAQALTGQPDQLAAPPTGKLPPHDTATATDGYRRHSRPGDGLSASTDHPSGGRRAPRAGLGPAESAH